MTKCQDWTLSGKGILVIRTIRVESHGPVDQEKVDIVKTERLETLVDTLLYLGMIGAP